MSNSLIYIFHLSVQNVCLGFIVLMVEKDIKNSSAWQKKQCQDTRTGKIIRPKFIILVSPSSSLKGITAVLKVLEQHKTVELQGRATPWIQAALLYLAWLSRSHNYQRDEKYVCSGMLALKLLHAVELTPVCKYFISPFVCIFPPRIQEQENINSRVIGFVKVMDCAVQFILYTELKKSQWWLIGLSTGLNYTFFLLDENIPTHANT